MNALQLFLMSGLLFSPFMLSGQAYFQQRVDHTITVRLDDVAHVLHAEGSFVYTNNSPSTLDTLWIHLWPNAYRDKTSALCKQLADGGDLDLHFAPEEERGWIDSLDFTADGRSVLWGYHHQHADIGWLKLNAPLPPNSSTTITTPFRVKIPDGKFSRLGHTGQAYYITQWYPKPAVFDATGWHAMPYLGNGEFYSEFGLFDVTVTLPKNYVVGATGVLKDPLEQAFMDSLAALPYADNQRFYLEKQRERLNVFPPSNDTTKTIRFTQDNVHDFAWFADKRFVVRKSAVALPESGRTVTTWALFTPKNAELWSDAVTYVNESVKLYSQWVGDYPYEACTALDGTISAGGGMEYPMITIIGDMSDKRSLDNVVAHEVGHNWFYGILASNERDHAWMDEGMNSFIELRYMRLRYPIGGLEIGIPGLKKVTASLTDPNRFLSEATYRLNARRNLDQPLSLTSAHFTEINYGAMVYSKTALVFDHLMAYLGEDVMDRCMRAYYAEWKFKHPQPEDVRTVFERESGQDLSWVFTEMIGTKSVFDPKALKYVAGRDRQGSKLTMAGKSIFDIPVPVTGFAGADSLGTAWILHGNAGKESTHELNWPTADRIRIDAGARTLDIDRRNNSVRSYGLFRRWAPLQFKWLTGIEQDDKRMVYYTPLPAFNGNDGLQVGLAAYNTTFPSQRTEWVVAPLYGFASERWGGAARIEHHLDRLRSPVLQNITLGLSGRSATEYRVNDDLLWFSKLSPYVRLDLRRSPLNKPWHHSIGLRGVHLARSGRSFASDGTQQTASVEHFYTELSYTATDQRKLYPTLIRPTITYEPEFLRAALELRQAWSYNDRKDQFRLRAFAGTFLWKRDDRLYNGLHAWGLSWGTQDMLFDHAYLERNARDDLRSRQYNVQQGAFKTPFRQGGSDTWIGALNMEWDLPTGLPLAVFASLGAVPITTVTQEGRSTSTATYFEAGIGIIAIPQVVEIWFPLAVSERLQDEEKFLDRTVSDRIRFIFALEKLDPTKALRKVKP